MPLMICEALIHFANNAVFKEPFVPNLTTLNSTICSLTSQILNQNDKIHSNKSTDYAPVFLFG